MTAPLTTEPRTAPHMRLPLGATSAPTTPPASHASTDLLKVVMNQRYHAVRVERDLT